MLHGCEVRELIEAHEVVHGAHGIAFIFRTTDGGLAALYLDHAEIHERAHQFEPPRHAPPDARLQ